MKNEFDKHWEKSNYQNVSKQKISKAEEFLKPVIGFLNTAKQPPIILDAGCGDGIHALVLANNVTKDFKYVGLDLSQVGIKLCEKRLAGDERFSFKVFDITSTYLEGEYDIIFSYGVIAYTGRPSETVKNLSHHLKADGLFVSWIYSPSFIEKTALSLLRILARILGAKGTDVLANLIVYLMKYLPVSSGVSLSNSTFEQCKETVLVNIEPKNLIIPSVSTVEKWYAGAGLKKESGFLYSKRCE